MPQHPVEIGKPGTALRGTVYLPDDVPRRGRVPTVLMLHGFTGNRIGNGFIFVNLARALNASGLAAVAFDFRHSGESDGSFDQMLVSGEVADALNMTRWLGGQPFVDRSRMLVLGHSLGGLVACSLTARERGYAGRILLAPTTVENLCRFAGEPGTADPVTVGAHKLHPDVFTDARNLEPLADAAKSPMPTLIIQAENDEVVPLAESSRYVDACVASGRPAKSVMIPTADHAFTRPEPRRTLIDKVVAWSISTTTS